MNTKNLIIVILVAIVGIGVGYYIGYDIGFERSGRMSADEAKNPAASALRVGENALYVPDQMPGKSVVVEFVTLAEAGFVVIHESIEGALGPILGKSDRLAPGLTEKTAITLSRDAKDGEELIVMLHHDDGDGGFDPAKDLPVKDAEGSAMMMPFSISHDAVLPDSVSW